jgi:opacity protein-like surface antigen
MLKKILVFLSVPFLVNHVALGSDFYLTTLITFSNLDPVKESNKQDNFKLSHKSSISPLAGIGGGYYINDNSRVDFTFERLNNIFATDTSNFNYKKDNTKKDVYVTGTRSIKRTITGNVFRLNYYVDLFNKDNSFKVFAGAGAGITHIKERKTVKSLGNFIINDQINAFPPVIDHLKSKTAKNFTYSLMIGLTKNLNPVTNFDITYSWRDYGKTKFTTLPKTVSHSYKGHHFSVGLRFDI